MRTGSLANTQITSLTNVQSSDGCCNTCPCTFNYDVFIGSQCSYPDGDNVLSLCQQPSQGQLTGSDVLFGSNLLYSLDELEILVKVSSLKPRGTPSVITRLKVVRALDPTREKPATKRTVCDRPNAQIPHRRQYLILGIPAPQGIFGLQGHQRISGMSSADRRGCCFRNTDVPNLPLTDQVGYGADRFFYGNCQVNAMVIIEIYVINPQPAE